MVVCNNNTYIILRVLDHDYIIRHIVDVILYLKFTLSDMGLFPPQNMTYANIIVFEMIIGVYYRIETAPSAALGGSSKFSNENFEGWSGERFHVNSSGGNVALNSF